MGTKTRIGFDNCMNCGGGRMNGMDLKNLMDVTAAKAVKEFAEKLKKKLFDFFEDNEELDGKISTGVLYVEIIGVEAEDGTIISLGLINELLKEYEK